MSSISLLLLKVHDRVHDLTMKVNYSEPKLYTGGVNISDWKKLSKTEKESALSKSWYLYYSYRNPETGKLQRQGNIKAGVNSLKDYRSRVKYLKKIKEALILLLEKGYSPYRDKNDSISEIENKFINPINQFNHKNQTDINHKNHFNGINQPNKTEKSSNTDSSVELNQNNNQNNSDEKTRIIETTFKEAITIVLNEKEKVLNKNSYGGFKSRIKLFKTWCGTQGIKPESDINRINKKVIIKYLNSILAKTSARNRNNYRTDLSTFFQVLVDNDIISDNFVRKTSVLKSKPTRNKTYTSSQQKEIFDYMAKNDPLLLLYVKFVSYNFLRPIEVCRLKIGDININEKKLYVKAKNHPVKTKIIPDILIKELPDLNNFSNEFHLFSPEGIGFLWEADETNKRNYFTKRFKKVKKHFNLESDYTLYSFRHTFITKLYKEMIKNGTPFEVKSKLKLITGHSTMTALEKYLRDIDAELPMDYSNLLE
jgi:integrase